MNDLTNLLKDEWVISSINDNSTIPPAHITIIPTSKSSAESEGHDVNYKELCNVIDIYKKLGARAATISGCSPSSHNRISDIIDYLVELNIDVGLIDNGISIDQIFPRTLNKLKWGKIVHSDHRSFNGQYENLLKNVISRGQNVDWSFVYDVTRTPNFYGIIRTINFAKENGFSSVDIVLPDKDINKVSDPVSSFVDNTDGIIIYKTRTDEKSSAKCFVSFLRPVLREDSKIYPCSDETKPSICSFGEFEKFINSGNIIEGCDLCKFSEYNDLLGTMMKENKHPNFV